MNGNAHLDKTEYLAGAFKHIERTSSFALPGNRNTLTILLFFIAAIPLFSLANEDTTALRFRYRIATAPNDSARTVALKDICWYYRYTNLDSAVDYGKKAIVMAQKTKNRKLEGDITRFIGISYWHYAYEEESLEWIYASLKIAEEINDQSGEAYCYDNIGNTFFSQGFFDKALENFSRAKGIFVSVKDDKGIAYTLLHSSWVYAGEKDFNTALNCIYQAVALRRKIGDSLLVSGALKEVANVYRAMGRYKEALVIYRNSKTVFEKANLHYSLADDYQQMAETFRLANMNDSAIFFGLTSLKVATEYNNYRQIFRTAKTLQLAYTALKNYERALFYQNLYYENKEKLLNDRVALRLARKDAEHEFGIKTVQLKNHNLDVVVILSSLLFIALVIAAVIYFSQKKTKEYNHLLEAKNVEITKQSVELRRLNEVKDKMFSVVSHDIRSPLTSLQSMLYLYNNTMISPAEMKELMPSIALHVNSTASFVDNLLYWSKTQFKGLSVSKTSFNLNECIQIELELLNKKASDKRITFQWDSPDELRVFADKDMIAIVMRNLLNNAVKFSSEGKNIFIKTTAMDKETIVCIRDEGKGMTEKQLANLFVTSNTTLGTAEETGTGLGLILSKDFVEKNNGRIWAESKLGVGSSFYVALLKNDI